MWWMTIIALKNARKRPHGKVWSKFPEWAWAVWKEPGEPLRMKEKLSSFQALDYSDDEKEQEAKRKLKNSRKKKDNSNKGV